MHMLRTDGFFDLAHRLLIARLADKVIASDMRVASVETRSDRRVRTQALDQLRDLLEGAAEGKFSSRCILNQNMKGRALPAMYKFAYKCTLSIRAKRTP